MIYKLQTNSGASYTILAEEIMAIEFPSPEQLKELNAPLIPDPLSPIWVHLRFGACFPCIYGQAQDIEKMLELWGANLEWLNIKREEAKIS